MDLTRNFADKRDSSRAAPSPNHPFLDAVTLLGQLRWDDALPVWRSCYELFPSSALSKTVYVDLLIRLGYFTEATRLVRCDTILGGENFPINEQWEKALDRDLTRSLISILDLNQPMASDMYVGSTNHFLELYKSRRYNEIVNQFQTIDRSKTHGPEHFLFFCRALFALGRYDQCLKEVSQCVTPSSGDCSTSLKSDLLVELLDLKNKSEARLKRRSDSIATHVRRFKASLAYTQTLKYLLHCDDLTLKEHILDELNSFSTKVGIFGDKPRLYAL